MGDSSANKSTMVGLVSGDWLAPKRRQEREPRENHTHYVFIGIPPTKYRAGTLYTLVVLVLCFACSVDTTKPLSDARKRAEG